MYLRVDGIARRRRKEVGCEDAVLNFLEENDADYSIIDETAHGKEISATFRGKERPEQQEAIQSCLDNDGVKPFVQDYGMVIVDEYN